MKIINLCMGGPYTEGMTYQDNLLPKFQKRLGNEVVIIASKWAYGKDGQLSYADRTDYINDDGVKVIRLDLTIGKNCFSKIKIYKNLRKVLDAEKPDIIFLHNCQYIQNIELVSYLKKNSVKLYVDNHADFSNSATNWLSRNVLHKIIWRYLVNLLLPYTEKFYGVLPARVNFLSDVYHLPSDKCELLVMGADDDLVNKTQSLNIRKTIRNKYNIDSEDILIVTGGKIDFPKKQTLLLMEAVNNLNRNNIKLLVFGAVVEGLRESIHALCNDCVKYIGWINKEESYELFAASDIICFPGRHSVYWEQAAGQGVPLIVKYWKGTSHIDLGGNVEFLYTDSEEEIRSKIEESIKPDKYESMKDAAQKKGMQVFSYMEIARKSIGQ